MTFLPERRRLAEAELDYWKRPKRREGMMIPITAGLVQEFLHSTIKRFHANVQLAEMLLGSNNSIYITLLTWSFGLADKECFHHKEGMLPSCQVPVHTPFGGNLGCIQIVGLEVIKTTRFNIESSTNMSLQTRVFFVSARPRTTISLTTWCHPSLWCPNYILGRTSWYYTCIPLYLISWWFNCCWLVFIGSHFVRRATL